MFSSILPKSYAPAEAEAIYAQWEANGYFTSAPDAARESYCILLPPPNVTGTLHMGHAFQHTLMDTLVRYHRMLGKNVLWQVGTDHAGIATQIVVTRQLEAKGVDPQTLSREEFLDAAWQWKNESGGIISQQMKRMGISADWSRECFTMDDARSAAVGEAFVQLYEKGLIYRGKRLINWDPKLLTAISDLEIISEEESGTMYYVRYPFVDDDSAGAGIVIGTTRPETILVDGAIAVHPDDERFAALVGRRVWVPLTEPRRAIEIIADTHVDPAFGSGCVKITAAHDFNDYEVAQRHPDKNIPVIILFTPDAKMNDNAPSAYRGLDRFAARKQIVQDLSNIGLLVDQKPHTYKLPRGDRSGVVVEPMLTNQWFMKMDELAQLALDLTRKKGGTQKLQFVPHRWQKIYQQWLENIHDWCISRQLLWGHQIPAWYDDAGKIYVARNETDAQAQAGGRALTRESDVLDTWFSSALWAFSTFGWPQPDRHFQHYFPTSVLVTGFDIIFFWVARMAMMTQHFIGDTPFSQVYVTGLVRDHNGEKMSKSKGNILDPLDLIDGVGLDALLQKRTTGLMNPKQADSIAAATRAQFPDGITAHGADTLRFTFASLATHGNDIKFDMSRCEGYRHFCNKIWNASRFVLGIAAQADDDKASDDDDGDDENLFIADSWILSRLQNTTAKMHAAFADYRFDLAAGAIYQFFWDDYCDWYLEAAKVQLVNGSAAVRKQTRETLLHVLEGGLRLCHPIIPFISEQLWQHVAPAAGCKTAETIMLADYPQADGSLRDAAAEAYMEQVQATVEAARQFRHQSSSPALVLFIAGSSSIIPLVKKLAGIREVRSVANASDIPADLPSTQLAGWTLAADYGEDQQALVAKWQKELTKIANEIAALDATLANPQFTAKAPVAVIAKKQARRAALATQQAELQSRLP